MDVPVGMSRKPLSDAFGFVSRLVVHHEMKVEFARRGAFQVAEKFEQFVLRMTLVALAIDLTGFHVEGCKERRGALPEIIGGVTFRPAGPERKDRLAALQCLDLAFHVHAKHQRVLRGTQVKYGNVPDLLNKKRVGGELERLDSLRSQSKRSPDERNPLVV